MKKRLLLLTIVLTAVALPGAATAQQLFDYLGMALLPAAEGGSLTMYGIIRDGAPATTTPIPLDFANFEYTLVVTDLVLVTDAYPEVYANGTIAIYRDGMTLADYAASGSFYDGSIILSGVVTTLSVYHYSDLAPTLTGGYGTGLVDWTGGANLSDIAPDDQDAWVFWTATNSGSSLLEPGYDEVWDGKVEPESPVVSTENLSWDAIKAMFEN